MLLLKRLLWKGGTDVGRKLVAEVGRQVGVEIQRRFIKFYYFNKTYFRTRWKIDMALMWHYLDAYWHSRSKIHLNSSSHNS